MYAKHIPTQSQWSKVSSSHWMPVRYNPLCMWRDYTPATGWKLQLLSQLNLQGNGVDYNTEIPSFPSYTFVDNKTQTRFILGQVCNLSPLQSGRKKEGVLLRSKQKMPVVTFKLLLWWKVLIAAIKWAFDPKTIIDVIKISGFTKHSFSVSEEAIELLETWRTQQTETM